MSTSTAVDQTFVFTDAALRISPSRTVTGELWVTGENVTYVGPRRTPYPDGARVVDASGASIVPLEVESALAARDPSGENARDLVPGAKATLVAVRGREPRSVQGLIVSPRDLLAVLVAGTPVAWHGEPSRPAGAAGTAPDDPRLGTWVDPAHALEQHLTADGRYSETRNGRRDAYTGRFWFDGDVVSYLDDQGFWAFGEFVDGVLYHAGFVMRRA